ncbi:uncharacterized protein LOC143416797 [Maylandia zebra]|uniref:uncharacterized protein LOC143416797 n=1 Tax=Maylandia zebra TaxID=106582 RepID=UPI00403C61EB
MRVRRESQERMEPAKKRRMSSPVWEHFDPIPPNKVKCLLCARELGYNNNTSSMLRHYRALHENRNTNCGARPGEQSQIDEDLVSMVIEDSQPFSIVEDKGFKRFVESLNPSYVLPTKKALKVMVEARYQKMKEKAKASIEKAAAVSLTSDIWTSNTEAYLSVTCHFVDESSTLNTVVLGVQYFPNAHTEENTSERLTHDRMGNY